MVDGLQVPLFMQAGRYLARDDRYLFAGSLYTSYTGDGTTRSAVPRPGVLPMVTQANGIVDQSFLVGPAVAGGPANSFSVQPGVAFVAGGGSGLSNVYQVVNETVSTVQVDSNFSGTVYVYLVLENAEWTLPGGGETGSTLAAAVFKVSSQATPEPNALLLAQATVAAGVPSGTPTDKREFTTSHGGTVVVRVASDLNDKAKPFYYLPVGSSAYALDTGVTYTRTNVTLNSANPWRSGSVIDTDATRPDMTEVGQGYQHYDRTNGTFSTYLQVPGLTGWSGSTGWFQTDGVAGWARSGTGSYGDNPVRAAEGSYGNWTRIVAAQNRQFPSSFDGTFTIISSFGSKNVNDPPTPDTLLKPRVLVHGKNTPVSASLYVSASTHDVGVNDVINPQPNGTTVLQLVLVIKKSNSLGGDGQVFPAYNPSVPTGSVLQRFGIDIGPGFGSCARTFLYSLDPGEYVFEVHARAYDPSGGNRGVKFYSISLSVSA